MRRLLTALVVGVALAVQVGCAASPAPVAFTKSGSMARFVAHADHLYALDGATLKVYDLQHPTQPLLVDEIPTGRALETVFPVGSLLFVGTRTALLVYDLEDPARPRLLGEAEHLYSCDPVVVQDDVAYVTLFAESACQAGQDSLRVFDVSNPNDPREIHAIDLEGPRGLGVDGRLLFVADAGLKVFDLSDPHRPRLVQTLEGVDGYDVIPSEGVLIVSARDGIRQYRYDVDRIEIVGELSHLRAGQQPVVVGAQP